MKKIIQQVTKGEVSIIDMLGLIHAVADGAGVRIVRAMELAEEKGIDAEKFLYAIGGGSEEVITEYDTYDIGVDEDGVNGFVIAGVDCYDTNTDDERCIFINKGSLGWEVSGLGNGDYPHEAMLGLAVAERLEALLTAYDAGEIAFA